MINAPEGKSFANAFAWPRHSERYRGPQRFCHSERSRSVSDGKRGICCSPPQEKPNAAPSESPQLVPASVILGTALICLKLRFPAPRSRRRPPMAPTPSASACSPPTASSDISKATSTLSVSCVPVPRPSLKRTENTPAKPAIFIPAPSASRSTIFTRPSDAAGCSSAWKPSPRRKTSAESSTC